MYLGSAIAGNGQLSETVNAAAISSGLNQLLKEVIGGSSLDDAVNKLTDGKFSSMADFEAKFNSVDGAPGLCDFTTELVNATGDGHGSLITGDLAGTHDGELSNISLFKQAGSAVGLSADTVSALSAVPMDLTTQTGVFGDFKVTGADPTDISRACSATSENSGCRQNGLVIAAQQPSENKCKRDRSLLVRFIRINAIPMVQKVVAFRCAAMA